ncbi:hypothetical protein Dimus_034789 [Dionaea muscipula]
MAEFPPNLDDGEEWIPSDIFPAPNQVSSVEIPLLRSAPANLRLPHMALMEKQARYSSPIPPPPPQVYGSKTFQYASTAKPPATRRSCGFGFHVGVGSHGADHGLYAGHQNVAPFDRVLQFSSGTTVPVPLQAEGMLMDTRAAASILSPPAGHHQNLSVANFQGGAVQLIGTTSQRDRGGTGVFLPRITTMSTADAATNDVRKKKGIKKGQLARQSVMQKETMRRVSVSKQEEYRCRLPNDSGLPKEWTY